MHSTCKNETLTRIRNQNEKFNGKNLASTSIISADEIYHYFNMKVRK